MKLIFLVILSLFFGHLKADTSAFDVAKKFNKTNEDHDKTKFTDLDPDCLFLILDYLPFGDLLRVAHVNDKYLMVAKDVFRYKYSQRSFIVDTFYGVSDFVVQLLNGAKIDADTIEQLNGHFSHLMNEPHLETSESATNVLLCNYIDIFSTFKHFGHLIKDFGVLNHERESKPSQKSAVIGYLISEYSSESLVDISLRNSPDQVLKYITKPLTKVENVKLEYSESKLETSLTRFSELFPAVRQLYLTDRIGDDPTFTDCHMPQLEHVFIKRFSETSSSFLNVISKNPQIRSIDLYGAEPDFLQNVSILLPQLQTLKLKEFHLEDASIRFENVTTCDTTNIDSRSLRNLHFPRLQTLRTHGRLQILRTHGRITEAFDEYLAFLNEHKHLSHLHLKYNYLEDSQFKRLTANLNDLVELTLNGIEYSSCNDIVEFIGGHDKVKQLNIIDSDEELLVDLQEHLKHEWNTRTIDHGVSFERK